MRPHVGQHGQPQVAKAQGGGVRDLADGLGGAPDGRQVDALPLPSDEHAAKDGVGRADQLRDLARSDRSASGESARTGPSER